MTRPIRTLIVDDEELARERIRRFLEEESDITIVGECGDGLEAVEAIRELEPELVFLDIQLPELDGFGVLAHVGVENAPAVIFVTAYDEYALKAFDFSALDYLLKPYNRERFSRALERARVGLHANDPGANLNQQLLTLLKHVKPKQKYLERLMVKEGGRVFFLHTDDIIWVSAEGNYVRLHAGKEFHLIRETMNRLASRLDPDKFLRIHRSTLVHVARIKELHPMFSGDYTVILHDNTELTLSRTYRDKVLRSFDDQA
ncbi:MAG: LytTR family DNA-binding domain-containing protein [Pyrinomonadaceae bacterium MAG19_C2-C3]|nr:LytTR family DNA-binding domain-containing protein [Pyrinomonadaceae bacterium MAG19_C2-C3]